MNKNYQKGASEFFLLALLASVVIIVVVFLLFFNNGSSALKSLSGARPTPSAEQVMEMSAEPVSDSDDVQVLQDELDGTVVGELDGDFELLDSDASTL